MEDLFKALGCFAVAVGCLWLPGVVGTDVPCSDVCGQPEDVWCSGASPDCPSHFEAWNEPVWNSLPPTMD